MPDPNANFQIFLDFFSVLRGVAAVSPPGNGDAGGILPFADGILLLPGDGRFSL